MRVPSVRGISAVGTWNISTSDESVSGSRQRVRCVIDSTQLSCSDADSESGRLSNGTVREGDKSHSYELVLAINNTMAGYEPIDTVAAGQVGPVSSENTAIVDAIGHLGSQSRTSSHLPSVADDSRPSNDLGFFSKILTGHAQTVRRQDSVISCGKARLVTISAGKKHLGDVDRAPELSTSLPSTRYVTGEQESHLGAGVGWKTTSTHSETKKSLVKTKNSASVLDQAIVIQHGSDFLLPNKESLAISRKIGKAVKTRFNRLRRLGISSPGEGQDSVIHSNLVPSKSLQAWQSSRLEAATRRSQRPRAAELRT